MPDATATAVTQGDGSLALPRHGWPPGWGVPHPVRQGHGARLGEDGIAPFDDIAERTSTNLASEILHAYSQARSLQAGDGGGDFGLLHQLAPFHCPALSVWASTLASIVRATTGLRRPSVIRSSNVVIRSLGVSRSV
jgi:hypothetical protein